MLFTIMNSQRTTLDERGYRFTEDSEVCVDELLFETIAKDKGRKYAEGLKTRLGEGLETICLGEDGVFYTVLFDTVAVNGEEPASYPIVWRELSVNGY